MKLVKSVVCVALLVSFVLVGLSSTAAAQSVLTDEEKAGLLWMREEEKLARDVYTVMYEKWGERIFDNISESEQTHMDAIKSLLDRYGLPDPAAGKGVGEFENLEIQVLYNELIARGNLSFEEALNVGVDIEEMDIEDLNDFIATAVKRDIKKVYTNLREGSYHHLAAFEYQL